MLLVGASSITFTKLMPALVVKILAKGKTKAVEWYADAHAPVGDLERAAEVRRLTEAAGMRILCYATSYRMGPPVERGHDWDGILKTAEALGAPTVRVLAGRRGWSAADRPYRLQVEHNGGEICDKAAEKGIRVGIKVQRGTLVDGYTPAINFLQRMERDNLRLLWQPPAVMDVNDSLKSLKAIRDKIDHIYVYNRVNGYADRRLLSEAAGPWGQYLAALAGEQRDIGLFIEYVRGDLEPSYLRDAETLHGLAQRTGAAAL